VVIGVSLLNFTRGRPIVEQSPCPVRRVRLRKFLRYSRLSQDSFAPDGKHCGETGAIDRVGAG